MTPTNENSNVVPIMDIGNVAPLADYDPWFDEYGEEDYEENDIDFYDDELLEDDFEE